jgi:CRP-like cAMP-binding protein
VRSTDANSSDCTPRVKDPAIMLRETATAFLTRALGKFAGRVPIHLATTSQERAAIFRLRYDVYVEEQRRHNLPVPEGTPREVHTPEDDLPDSALYYVGTPERLEATVRLRTFGPGAVPPDLAAQFSFDRFPDMHTLTVLHVGFLIAPPTFRGSTSVVALLCGSIERTILEQGAEVLLADCAPGHLRTYYRLGMRAYGGRTFSTTIGLCVPVVAFGRDLEHLRRAGSPLYSVLRRLDDEGKLPTRDITALQGPLETPGVELDPVRIAHIVDAALALHDGGFLTRLPPATRARLLRSAAVLEVDSDVEILRQGYMNRDLFVLLEGTLSVHIDGVQRRTLGPSSVLGEVAFFAPSVGRSASVRSVGRCRLLHLRPSALKQLAHRRPAEGLRVYTELARVLAERLSSATPGHSASTDAIGDSADPDHGSSVEPAREPD